MKGITFEIPNAYGEYLFDILDANNIKEMTWKFSNTQRLSTI